MKKKLDVSRFLVINEIPSEQQRRWVVGAGDGRMGQGGVAIATIGFKHAAGYEVVLHLDNGKQDSFNPHQLSPELP
ncbi:hypothetical protein L1889_18035 [Paenalcaligenes niemegkensis]|uniref:hypothetical protein n=1 Tax=Paenalcaligenes niemegkensis TaxID=2895469 RepID=UPI001EE9120D|nr:hypothetical protein [Paenalcaligenes niemegkensis]MCQ9618340.1 hypothetical protein [Paenalcaligenes niemegkensis]